MTANLKKAKHGAFKINSEKRTREAFILSCEGYTQREIAEKLGVALGTVNRYLKEAHTIFDAEWSDKMKGSVLAVMQKKLRQCNKIIHDTNDIRIKLNAMEQYRKFLSDITKMCGLNDADKLDVTTKGEPILRLNGTEWSEL